MEGFRFHEIKKGKRQRESKIPFEGHNMYSKTQISNQSRIRLTEPKLKIFFKYIFNGNIPELATEKGLPYTLVYNLVHGRIRSLSSRDYKIIFGEEPQYQETGRTDGGYFRRMVKLWLFLNDEITEANLYREFYPDKKLNKIDYRIFNGEIKTVQTRIEKMMEQKFFDQGFDPSEIKKWIADFDQISDEKRVLYEDIKPVLDYLEKNLEVNPTLILNQWVVRYESGELKTVPQKIYDHALTLKKRTEDAMISGSKFEIEKLREEIYGKKDGLTLYYEIEGELEFLQKYGGKSPKKYLGRSIQNYKKSKLKRIASWRAQKIKDDCMISIIRGNINKRTLITPNCVSKTRYQSNH